MANVVACARRRAVVSVDQINAFFEDGELPVPGASETILPSNFFLKLAESKDWVVAFVRDNHPEESIHFKPKGPWPKHGVHGTWSAQFRTGLYLPKIMKVFCKGSRKNTHGYNGATKALRSYLFEKRVFRVYIIGLATDYCVMATAIGLCNAGFAVVILTDACRAVKDDDGAKAIKKMRDMGIKISTVAREAHYV